MVADGLCGAVLLFWGGIFSVAWGYWLWKYPTSIKPGTLWYRWFEADYHSVVWLFRMREKEFASVAERFIKDRGKKAMVAGLIVVAVGVWGLVQGLGV